MDCPCDAWQVLNCVLSSWTLFALQACKDRGSYEFDEFLLQVGSDNIFLDMDALNNSITSLTKLQVVHLEGQV
jgi:hypothetical protein